MLTLTNKNRVIISFVLLGAVCIYTVSSKTDDITLVSEEPVIEKEQADVAESKFSFDSANTDQELIKNEQLRLPAKIQSRIDTENDTSHEHNHECLESLKIAAKNLETLKLDPEAEKRAEAEFDRLLAKVQSQFEEFVYNEDGYLTEKSAVLEAFENEIVELEQDASTHVEASLSLEIE